MIGGKRVLAVVPARGGSKGIHLKNLRPVQGVPIVARVGDCVKAVPEIDRAVVSTDHEEIAAVAQAAGLAAPFRRPGAISGDRIGDVEVLRHALEEMERLDQLVYDIVVMLQPTSPMRQPEHISATLDMMIAGNWDAVWTVSQTDSKSHPLKQLNVSSGKLTFYDSAGAAIIARQQLEPVYHRNGVAYAMTRECLVGQRTIHGKCTGALVLEGYFANIDTEFDFELLEFILARQSAGVSRGK